MPSIFIYEHLVATEAVNSSMLTEGRAMRDAISEDFNSMGWKTVESGQDADYALVIAPECEGWMNAIMLHLRDEGYRLINCASRTVYLTSDKLDLYHHWMKSGVKTPRTAEVRQWWRDQLPAVVKPRDGAGSTDVKLIRNKDEWCEVNNEGMIAQDYVRGRAASIAFLVGPEQTIPLTPCWQVLADGEFNYLGGQLPLSVNLAERALMIGYQAIDCIDGLRGYIGVDLVLGEAEDGSQDYAIEINPRLTTSYVGLRALADFNLAQAMLDVVEGRPVDYIKWKPGRVRFWPDGRVEYDPTPGAVWE